MKDIVKYRERLPEKRDDRIYVRVSSEEKTRIQAAARAAGYRSVGAYLVSLALPSATEGAHLPPP